MIEYGAWVAKATNVSSAKSWCTNVATSSFTYNAPKYSPNSNNNISTHFSARPQQPRPRNKCNKPKRSHRRVPQIQSPTRRQQTSRRKRIPPHCKINTNNHNHNRWLTIWSKRKSKRTSISSNRLSRKRVAVVLAGHNNRQQQQIVRSISHRNRRVVEKIEKRMATKWLRPERVEQVDRRMRPWSPKVQVVVQVVDKLASNTLIYYKL